MICFGEGLAVSSVVICLCGMEAKIINLAKQLSPAVLKLSDHQNV